MNAEELASAARTVVDVAAHFRGLKERAAALADQIAPQDRGYFTPAEDDEARALLASYWQARNALFELVTSFRDEQELDDAADDESRLRAFLIAFTAALVLVDAARFLRELVERRPVVRRKLNEPAPQLGVPGGVYDTVQKSLVSARHGWHLFHAIRFFNEHEPRLRKLSADPACGPLLTIVDQLKPRLDVSIRQFASAKLRTRADQVTRRLARSLFGRAMYGLQKVSGSLVADKYLRYGHKPQLPAAIAEDLRGLLAPGDVLIVRKEYALTNYFLPGYWPHAALYLGDVEALMRLGVHEQDSVKPRWARLCQAAVGTSDRVLESMKDGVHVRCLSSPLASDSVVVLRPQLGKDQLASAITRSLSHEGKAYDFDFDFSRADRLVCTEVVYRAYDGVGAIQIPLTRRAGRPTLSGSDLIKMGIGQQHFAPVAVYAPQFAGGIVQGAAAEEILRSGEGEPLGA